MHLHDILKQELARFGDRPLRILETGTIRNAEEHARIGDGWSTLFFAEHQKRIGSGGFTSIDLEIDVANAVLRSHNLDTWVGLVRGYSISVLAGWTRNLDVIFLDSDNDATLILHEFMIAQHLIADDGIILIDDVRMPGHPPGAKKGDQVWPYIQKLGLPHHVTEREGWNGYRTGVLVVEPER